MTGKIALWAYVAAVVVDGCGGCRVLFSFVLLIVGVVFAIRLMAPLFLLPFKTRSLRRKGVW